MRDPKSTFTFTSRNRVIQISTASREDIQKIFEFALGRYGDCKLNGTDVKLPWWEKNPFVFYIIRDENDKICANLNLLPINERVYMELRRGSIMERDILPDDIFSITDGRLVKYIYVEGFNCAKKIFAKAMLSNLPYFVSSLTEGASSELTIGANAGTQEGERIMRKLGFKSSNPETNQDGNGRFLEITFNELFANIVNRFA